ncbi:hypothetical protein GCM10010399_38400 [Dactylosporangium fulvum]|uniref:Excalibur calcium-binding domain-containing protein n=1 Tax=Dactylosporangium fulvum TaxID=53359 RepID=A0ABY5W3Z5_9ACTN|nr:excalibur calcium-binding domain-containing protein [Dactylosporangium fulvum]UWP84080.1 hypothetical protein Dfulv_07455 [Dactylosporangium fulvum]
MTYQPGSRFGTPQQNRNRVLIAVAAGVFALLALCGIAVAAAGTGKPPASNCHPSYRPCVPTASDVDCAGGGGNGPKYVQGPITVIGPDVYDLDRDGDGVACE